MRGINSFPVRWLLLLLVSVFLLQGCGNEYAEQAKTSKQYVAKNIQTLATKLNSGQIANALLVKNYAQRLEQLKPDLEPVARAMSKDATVKGNLYQGLLQRLDLVRTLPVNKTEYVQIIEELQSLEAASDPAIFNDSLLDLVNTLADLSGGELNRINIPKDAATAQVKGEGGTVPGSYLVGNPNYGNWQTDASGNSFWAFYGQYHFFTSLFSGPGYYGRRVYYNDWNERPRYSYHRDYGRHTYGSRSDRSRSRSLDQKMTSKGVKPAKPKLKYGSAAGQKRRSTYTTMQTNFRQSTGKKFGSGGGPRHAGGATKRTSSLFGGSAKPTSTSTPKRSSSLFGGSARNATRSRRGFGGFGGK